MVLNTALDLGHQMINEDIKDYLIVNYSNIKMKHKLLFNRIVDKYGFSVTGEFTDSIERNQLILILTEECEHISTNEPAIRSYIHHLALLRYTITGRFNSWSIDVREQARRYFSSNDGYILPEGSNG